MITKKTFEKLQETGVINRNWNYINYKVKELEKENKALRKKIKDLELS